MGSAFSFYVGDDMADLLFRHNREAYDAAMAMLAETGKAAIIHPTGTGKSFIGFQLCLDHPGKRVCWLSPSEYIFKTQLENLIATGREAPDNISFFTYAKLSLMQDEELQAIRPDYIVADEFHRMGAEHWQRGAERLFRTYPDAPVLGLTATNIRYLDNQRDMADELFDGNVASEITLGEAIVRGILNPPKYVLSVFSYQNELEKYEKRIRSAKNKAVRDEANEYFEALRRALAKAEGLDEIFARHMEKRSGKYLVFCSNVEHLDEMIAKAPAFFSRVDSAPHVYRAYADDPGTSKAFAAFKADESEHLKLLFSIDMLNEGIHVDDVDGVILFRPTVSPIVYKQQIGRAISVGKKDAVIFDIVNNIENLYAIGAIEQEMRLAVSYYRSLGEGDEIVNERFRVFDEVRDVRELFERLNDTLTASWELMYSHAAAYYREHGNLEVQRRYKTSDGYSLGSWILTQRKVYNGEQQGVLGEDRIKKLEEIGMVWDSMRDLSWQRYYTEARRYREANGDLRVPIGYVTENGLRLGEWIANQRSYRKNHIRAAYLTPERIAALDALGMIWDVPDYLWMQYYSLAVQYHREHGDLMVPKQYVSPDGLRLGSWIASMRNAYTNPCSVQRLSEEQIHLLNELDMCWNPYETKWINGFSHAEEYFARHGDLQAPHSYKSKDGYALGVWLDHQREAYQNGKLRPERVEKLNALGFIWEKPDPWEQRYALASAYYQEHGNLLIPPKYKADGIWLAKWLNEQRQIFIGNRPGKSLTEDQVERLNAIGMEWDNRIHKNSRNAWAEQYEEAKLYYEEKGNLSIPGNYRTSSGKRLGDWVQRQRNLYKNNKLTEEQKHLLDDIGMQWELDPWEAGFEHARQYFEANGSLIVPNSYICDDGYRLGSWLANQKSNYKSSDPYRRVSETQKRRLDEIGMVWDLAQLRWEEGFQHACEYLKALNGQRWRTNYLSSDGYKTGAWMRAQVRAEQRGSLLADRKALLEKAGLRFETHSSQKVCKPRERRAGQASMTVQRAAEQRTRSE